MSERALRASLDDSSRSCASLDDDVLEELAEELYDDGNDRGERGSSSRRLLLSWRRNDSSMRSIHHDDLEESTTRSEGDLEYYADSCGFLDWPSLANGAKGTIEEEPGPVKTEEDWNIADYEQSTIDDSVRSGNSRIRLSQSFTKKFRICDKSPSLASSFSSQEGSTGLSKIKETLLNTKNKQQQQGIEGEENNEKRVSPLARIIDRSSAFRRSSTKSDTDESSTQKSQEAIWVRERDIDSDEVDQYRNIYAPAPTTPPQRKGLFSKGQK